MPNPLQKFIQPVVQSFTKNTHRPAELLLSIAAFVLLYAMSRMVVQEAPPAWEITSFRYINDLPDFLFPVIWPFMQYGVFITIPVVATIAAYTKRFRLALMLLLGGIGIYYLARYVKILAPRGRPDALLPHIHAREKFAPGSSGFTSGHTAVASTIATLAHYYLSKRWQIISITTLGIVMFGRIYIGGHMPLDVLGGVTLGVGVASLANFILGVPVKKAHKEESTTWITQHRPHHPGDLIRMFLAGSLFLITTLLAFTGSVGALEESLFRVINNLPDIISPAVQLVMQMGALYFVFIAAGIGLLLKHYRSMVKLLFGGVFVWYLTKFAKMLVDRDRPFYILSNIHQRATNSGILGFPSGHAAVSALIATVISPYVSKNWSRIIWGAAWATALGRMYVGAHLPLDIIAGLSMGWFFGSLLNFAFGTPAKDIPFKCIKHTFASAGMPLSKIAKASVDARGSVPLFAEIKNGPQIFIKLVSSEQRSADILYRLWRYATLRGIEDEAPFTSAKLQAEHEAYVSIQAAQAGVNTPEVLLATSINNKTAFLATKQIDGLTLNQYKGEVTPELLNAIWSEVAKLHKKRIAHRDLRSANVLIGRGKKPWLIDFSFAATAASNAQLSNDITELLMSLALLAGPKEAVASAVSVLGHETVKHVQPYLQPLALTTATKRQLRKYPDLLNEVAREIQSQTNSLPMRRARLTRLNYRWIILLFVTALTIYVLTPRFGEVGQSLQLIKNMDLHWIILALVASAITYCMSAIAVMGSIHQKLSFKSTVLVQLATTAVNRITPKGVGGFALTEQYLERSGLKRIEATASVAAMYAVGVLVHIVLLAGAFIFVRPDNFRLGNLSATEVLIGGGIILLISLSAFLIPRLRRFIVNWSKELLIGIKRAFSRKDKFVQLVGGSAGITIAYAVALYCTLEGFGSAVPFASVLLVYLASNAIASAAPTPGGLGAIEAALTLALTALGVPIAQAITGVLVFRLATFWLPIAPALPAFHYVVKKRIA
jgi:glycosyltransferase 2 family protein